jgi:hypothetical protein
MSDLLFVLLLPQQPYQTKHFRLVYLLCPWCLIMPVARAYLTEVQAAAMIGMSPKTLKNWRTAGIGPAWAKPAG